VPPTAEKNADGKNGKKKATGTFRYIYNSHVYTSFQVFFLHFLIIEPTILHFFQKQNCNFLGISPTQTLGHRFSLRLDTVPADLPLLNPPRLDFVGRFFSASEELNATLVKCQAVDASVEFWGFRWMDGGNLDGKTGVDYIYNIICITYPGASKKQGRVL